MGPGKIGLTYLHTLNFFVLWHLPPVLYELSKSISFIEFLINSYMYDYILVTILITDKLLLHFKLSKSYHILLADKTDFHKPRQT